MKRHLIVTAIAALLALTASAQSDLKKIYDENTDPVEQIDKAVRQAKKEGKFVISQVGGNWCRWCLMFADFVEKDAELTQFIDENFVFIHSNYNPRERAGEKTLEMLKKLGNPERFGFPVFVVMDQTGKVIHTQDSSFLEEGNGYSRDKVVRFFQNWTPEAVVR
ncbi:MAG: thioredoxin family protein [Firmicutes bacterium]|nr:thioredoxin family protein [Bacillota bacterium]